MDKEFLRDLVSKGVSSRKIAEIVGLHRNTVSYWIKKHGLEDEQHYRQRPATEIGKIDTKEKAYLVGFIAGDGWIGEDGSIEISIQIKDKEILDLFKSQLDGEIALSHKLDKKKRIFPRARFHRKIKDIKKIVGGTSKKERHLPRVPKDLERYLLLGFFDAEGCITWGRRKDRNRVWQKISFTSHLKMLTAVQNILYKQCGVPSTIRPKSGEDCFVLEIASKDGVLKILNYIYPNNEFIILNRKYENACALRLELGEFGGTTKVQYRAELAEQEGVETTGECANILNNQNSTQGCITAKI